MIIWIIRLTTAPTPTKKKKRKSGTSSVCKRESSAVVKSMQVPWVLNPAVTTY